MHDLIRCAILVKTAEHFGISGDVQQKIADFARNGEAERIVPYIDSRASSSKDREMSGQLRAFRSAVLGLNKGVQFDGDCATMIANYQQLTGKEFEKPAWLSSEMKKV